jgi:hypothetical protein
MDVTKNAPAAVWPFRNLIMCGLVQVNPFQWVATIAIVNLNVFALV